MIKLHTVAAMAAVVLMTTLDGFEAHAQTSAPVQARNVVLVHGAWADGSSWSEVIPRLQAAGLHVTAVQNPLTSLADSVAATRRALALQDGPTVLVAHSWGGTVISETGMDPKVTALVYVAARGCRAGARCRGGFCRPVRKVPHHAAAGRCPGARRLHQSFRGGFSQIFRERCSARK